MWFWGMLYVCGGNGVVVVVVVVAMFAMLLVGGFVDVEIARVLNQRVELQVSGKCM